MDIHEAEAIAVAVVLVAIVTVSFLVLEAYLWSF